MPIAPAPMTPTANGVFFLGMAGYFAGAGNIAYGSQSFSTVAWPSTMKVSSAPRPPQFHRSVAVAHDRPGGARGNQVQRHPLPGAGQQDARLALHEPHDEAVAVELAGEGRLGELLVAPLLWIEIVERIAGRQGERSCGEGEYERAHARRITN
jgi:hypothetical protein